MYIIKTEPYESGARPSLQTWNKPTPPSGYVLCPEEFKDIFYSTSPAGFVNIEIQHNIVTDMTVNQEALDAYIASLLEPEPEPEPQASDTEVLNTLLGVETEDTNG